MKKVLMLLGVSLFLASCGSKSVVQKQRGSADPLPRYEGAVCLLTGQLPSDLEYVFLGRAVANQQQYGGYARVNAAVAEVARNVGADVVYDLRSKQKIGAFAVVRPQSWGMAVRLKSPDRFDCQALGGKLYYPGAALPSQTREPARQGAPSTTPSETKAGGSAEYDACMARVMRITDKQLRLEAMSACDGITR